MISLFDDANDFSWDAAKASHAVLLCRMEQGEVKRYTEVDKIDRIRRAYAQRHQYPSMSTQTSSKFGNKTPKAVPRLYFNQNMCNQSKTHKTKGVVYKPICSASFTNGKAFNHSEVDCKNKQKKN